MHPNNAGREAVAKYFQGHPRIRILQAINYLETCHLLVRCRFVVTDSGGIQEEATTLGMPVVVCRKTTERMEAVQSGFAKLVGTDVQSVLQGMSWATQASQNPKRPNSIFGDGKSSQRISAELFF
jgi:UDP-N-acetylglucosamine 2-epimerase (non-hydrolysing)